MNRGWKKILLYYLQWQPTTLELFFGELERPLFLKANKLSVFSVTDFSKLEKPWKIKWAYCSNGHDQPMDAIYKKVPSLEKKTPVTNLGCEGTWHLYKLATNWTLVYGHLNLTPGWSFQSIFGHFWTNGHDWISRPGLYLMAGPRNSIRFTLSENPKEWIKNEVF